MYHVIQNNIYSLILHGLVSYEPMVWGVCGKNVKATIILAVLLIYHTHSIAKIILAVLLTLHTPYVLLKLFMFYCYTILPLYC